MKKSYVIFSLALIVVMLSPFLSVAQSTESWPDDDPRYDRLPSWYYERESDAPLNTEGVITINDFDNFFLGVDFAEGHISEHPSSLQKYFTVFNTNGPWHTENGQDYTRHIPSFGGSVYGDPVSAYDSLGNLYYENMHGSGGTVQGCKVVVSSNNGQTWSNAVVAITGVDKNWIAADQTSGPYANYIYTVMTANSGGNFARSTDHGSSWQSTSTFNTQSVPGMMVAVGPNENIQGGSVYVVTNSGSSQASTYTFYVSHDGGATFQYKSAQNFSGYVGTFLNSRHSVQGMRTRPYPFIAADNSYGDYRGRLYLVYASNDPPGSGNKPDIWCRYSDNQGQTWSSAVRVNDDFNPTTHHQWHPAIWCDKETGRLYVQWMDSRDTPTSDSALIYATYSDNGGQTFAQNQAVSNKKMRISCSTCGGGGDPRYQGDYNGVVSNDKVAKLTWADWRNGNFGSYTGYFPDFAMRIFPQTLSFSYSDTLWFEVPAVKLYDQSVLVQVSINPPPSGSFTYSYPEGFVLTTLPGVLPIVITATDVPPGNYPITVTGKGSNGTPIHQRSATLQVLPASPPVAAFEADTTTICAGGAINFTDLSQNSPSQWEWQFPGGNPATSDQQNPAGIVYDTPGLYDVSLTVTNVAGSDAITLENYITVLVVPDAPTGDSAAICDDEPVPLLTASGDNVTWYAEPELLTVLQEGNSYQPADTLLPGEYLYYVTQSVNGCQSQALIISLTIYAIPVVTIEPLEALCEDAGTIVLTGGQPEGGIYSGTGVDGGIFDPALAGVGVHDIIYAYTDENGCSAADTTTIEVYPAAVVSLGDDQDFCETTTVTLDAGTGFASYLWSDGSTGQTFTTGEPGTYFISVANASGCQDADTVVLTMTSLPDAIQVDGGPVEVDNFLEPTSQYTSTGTTDATSYTWLLTPTEAGNLVAEGLTADITWTPGYTGTAGLTITGMNDCGSGPTSDEYSINVYSSQGIAENPIGTIRIYPNPNRGTFSLEITSLKKKVISLSLYNAIGMIIYQKQGISVDGFATEVISLENVSPGMMILQLNDGRDTWTEKVFLH